MNTNLTNIENYSPQDRRDSLIELRGSIEGTECVLYDKGFNGACSYVATICEHLTNNNDSDVFFNELHVLMEKSSLIENANLERDILDLIEDEVKSLNEAIPPRP